MTIKFDESWISSICQNQSKPCSSIIPTASQAGVPSFLPVILTLELYPTHELHPERKAWNGFVTNQRLIT